MYFAEGFLQVKARHPPPNNVYKTHIMVTEMQYLPMSITSSISICKKKKSLAGKILLLVQGTALSKVEVIKR